jgi:O-antigen/teichoic acid export membrane protein
MTRPGSRSLAVLAKETLLYLPAIGGPAIVGVLGLVVLTRLVSPAAYGRYAVALSVATMAAAVLGDWLAPTLIRFQSEPGETRRAGDLRHYLVLAWVSSVIAAVFVILSLGFILPVGLTAAGAVLAVALIQQKLGLAVLRAKLLTRAYSLVSVVIALLSFGAGIGWYLATRHTDVLIWATSIVLIASLLPIARMAHIARTDFHGAVEGGRLRELTSFGVPIIITAVGAQALLLADRYLLTTLSGEAAVGLYVPNYAIAERAMGFAFSPLFNALYPLAARAWARDDHDEAIGFLTLSHRLFLVIGGYVALLLVLVGDRISALMLGSDFTKGSSIIGLVALGNLVWFEGILFHQPLELAKKTRAIMVQALSAGVLNVGLNLALIPPFGLMGAAWATLGSYVAYTVTAYLWAKSSVGRQAEMPVATVWRVGAFALVALGVSAATQPTGAGDVVFIVAATVSYPLWLLLTGEPVVKELRAVMQARSR